MKDSKKRMEEDTAEELTMNFMTWYAQKLKSHKTLRPHHYDAILAFFKNNGLSEQETSEKFDSMLKVFGF